MKPTLTARRFWRTSLEDLQRFSQIVLNLEAIKGAQQPYMLHAFDRPDSIDRCVVSSDQSLGGHSTCWLDWQEHERPPRTPPPPPLPSLPSLPSSPPPPSLPSSPPSPPPRTTTATTMMATRTTTSTTTFDLPQQLPPITVSARSPSPPGYARFHGAISDELPADRSVQRSGWAAWRTRDRGRGLFGPGVWDVDPYVYLGLRVRSDGRGYFINVQTESIVPTDVHRHRLFARRPGEWETVYVRWNDFVRTNRGEPVEPANEMLRRKVRTIGIGLTDRIPGPFELCIQRVWAAVNNDAE